MGKGRSFMGDGLSGCIVGSCRGIGSRLILLDKFISRLYQLELWAKDSVDRGGSRLYLMRGTRLMLHAWPKVVDWGSDACISKTCGGVLASWEATWVIMRGL